MLTLLALLLFPLFHFSPTRSVCLFGFVRFLGGFYVGCGFGWLIEDLLGHLYGGFVFFVGGLLGLCLF
jgi:hypothetical protein